MNDANRLIDVIINVSQAASDDAARWNLGGVYVEIMGSRVRVQATDGHILALQEFDALDFASFTINETYFVPSSYIPALKTLQKSKFIVPLVQDRCIVFNETFKIRSWHDQIQAPQDYATKLGIYTLKESSTEGATVPLNADLLTALCKALRPTKTVKSQSIRLRQKDANSPALVKSVCATKDGSTTTYGLIMPMRE